MRLVYTAKVSSLKVFFLLAGPGLYAVQLLSRFTLSSMDLRQVVDITYICSLIVFGLFAFTIPRTKYTRWVTMFSLLTFFFNIGSLVNGYTTLAQVLYSSISFIFLPAFLAVILFRGPVTALIENFLFYFVMPLLFLNFATAFIELSLRGITALSGLQITGRSYELIALSIASLLLASRLPGIKTRLLYFGFFITIAMSFSRGAILVFTIMFLENSMSSMKQFLKWIGIATLVIFMTGWLGLSADFINLNFGNLLEFWEKRLNYGADFSVATEFGNMSGGRLEIFSYCLGGLSENPLFGVGIGQTQSYFLENYSNIAYSGCHNLFVTPLLERGIIGAISCYFLIAVAVYKVCSLAAIRGRIKPVFLLGMFLLFVSSTGAEFFVMSSSIRNANILITIFLIIFVFSNRPKSC